ncbi:hypothetical protein PQ455_14410 [Sphingomonas naphthae]|uniref:Uncharacterized protein n=1 Tax=Sphingomonas naphthae TaxID=1813468 RepID=A0ABY7TLT8_9SPHN|nr:hypothetical protein [Sphingomonas naphthae]WCT72819.1 hypothetical protein PQ455_14410 [Sphingomonas naphthae]
MADNNMQPGNNAGNQQQDRNQQADRQQNQQGSEQRDRDAVDPNRTHDTDTGIGKAGENRDRQDRDADRR